MVKNSLDDPVSNDNRNYNYSKYKNSDRVEYSYILKLVEPDSKILDLGCGNGSLIQKLIKEKNANCTGVEISKSGIDVCRQKGLNVIESRIDMPLGLKDESFDYSICNVTIQMVMYPEVLLKEMKRISRYQIISFPNFGFYKNRIDLLLRGRMPRPTLFGYSWYSTGHIHQLSIKDFYELIDNTGGLKVKKVYLESSSKPLKNFLMKKFTNTFQLIPIFLLEKF